jgi:hypothetical protein
MRLILCALLSIGLHAQQNAVPPSATSNAIKRTFDKWNPKLRATQPTAAMGFRSQPLSQPNRRHEFASKIESAPPLCSIPLLDVTPPAKGAMRTITPPETESNMPQLKMPAPPCRHF